MTVDDHLRRAVDAEQAKSAADDLRSLAASLAAANGVDAVAAVVIDQLPVVCGVDFCNVAVLAPDRSVVIRHPAILPEPVAARWTQLPLDVHTPLSDAIRTGSDVVVTGPAALADRYPDMVADAAVAGLECLAAVAVVDESGASVAAIGLGSASPDGCAPERHAAVLALCGAAIRRALATDQVARSAALLDTLIRRAPVGVAFLDRELRFVMVNEALAAANGRSADDHVGRTVEEVVPDVAAAAVAALQRVLETGRPVTGVHLSGRTAATPDEVRTWEESFYPVATPDGQVIGIGAIVEDVTDRLRAAADLVSLTDRLRLALRASGAGVFEWTPSTGDVSWTAGYADLLGFDATSANVDRWHGAIHPDDRARVSGLPEMLRDVDEWEDEHRVVHATRGVRWVHSVATARRNPDGTVAAVIGIGTDITERKLREIELERLHRRQRDIAERLQTGLLPAVVPEVDGYEVAVQYRPGTDGLRVGGDWYDVIRVDEDDIALVVGDVVGHDLEAAIAMAQLRHATVGLTYAHREPADVLADLDHLVSVERAILGSTMLYARLDRPTGRTTFARAGHLPPLIMAPGRPAWLHRGTTGGPLGVLTARTNGRLHLEPGQTMIAYTDGLVEHRRESIESGLQRLLDTADALAADAPLVEITDRLVDAVPHPERRDDIALVAIRRR